MGQAFDVATMIEVALDKRVLQATLITALRNQGLGAENLAMVEALLQTEFGRFVIGNSVAGWIGEYPNDPAAIMVVDTLNKLFENKKPMDVVPTAIANDHTCPSCGNMKVSIAERTSGVPCWKCGGRL